MINRILLSAFLCCYAFGAAGQGALDLIVASEETVTLEPGMYEYRNVNIMDRGTLVLKGGTTIASETFSSGDGATIAYQGNSVQQQNISISTFDASGLKFLYIDANGKPGADRPGIAATGGNGRDAHKVTHSLSEPKGRSSHGGGPGAAGAPGGNGYPAANVGMHLPNLKVGSLLRIHANGGSGGKGQQGGRGGKGGEGAAGHPASKGGSGGPGGNGGNAGNAGKISVYLIVADDASAGDREDALKTLRLEYANNAGTPGEAGPGGPGGSGGKGAPLGGDGTRGSGGSLGSGGRQGAAGDSSLTKPDQHWTVTNVLTQSQYALQYTQTLQKIRASMSRE